MNPSRRCPWLFAAVVAAAALTTTTTTALAQPDDSAAAGKVPVARRLYEEGVEAVNAGRWSVAHDRFKASYELSPRVLTLFNLAGAQAQTSRFVEASESYRRFLRETADGRYPDLRTEATASLAELEKQIAQLRLSVTNLDAADQVLVDEVAFPQAALEEPYPINPGAHTIVVKRNGGPVGTKQITLAPGAAERVLLELPKVSPNLQVRPVDGGAQLTGTRFTDSPAERGDKEGGSVLKSPWLWTAVGVVVVGAAVGAYVMTRPEDGVIYIR